MNDQIYMQRCFDLASLGLGTTSPNPLVGSVIVHQGKIIGEGYHKKAGQPHAEVEAINRVSDSHLLSQATLYVNLEPCSHHGRTPPCADLIIQKNIPRVVISTIDSSSKVSGRGIDRLRSHGIEVKTGVLEAEGRQLNKRFFCIQENNRPYIILKWAQSADGFIDLARIKGETPHVNWITGLTARKLVHKWRAEEDAILIGTHTALLDNPSLTLREWPGSHPLRIVIDRTNSLPLHLSVLDGRHRTLIFTSSKNKTEGLNSWIQIDFEKSIIPQVLHHLAEYPVNSVIVEGGAVLLQAFIDSDMWDEARIFTGNQPFHEGVRAPVIPSIRHQHLRLGDDMLQILKNPSSVA